MCAKITLAEGVQDTRRLPHSEEKAKIDLKKCRKLYQNCTKKMAF
jgi:hypothetical protein